jgi:F-type H+-transporting ATPase subunit gamma
VHLARERLINTFTNDEGLDKVFVIFSEFKSVMTQRVVVEQILPIAQETKTDEAAVTSTKDYIFEQPPAEIFGRLLPRMVEMQIYRALLESIASELGARMTAMEAATKNAGELISTLTPEYEPCPPGGNHTRDYRNRFRRGSVVGLLPEVY